MDKFRNKSITGHFAFRPILIGVAALGLSGCSTMLDPYGYGGVSVGYGGGGYYDSYGGYYDPYYDLL